MFSDIEFPSMKALFSSAASMTGTIIFLRTIANDIIPPGLLYYLSDRFGRFMAALSSTTTVIIDEYEELNKNGLFSAAQVYISTIASPSTRRFRVSLPEKEKTIHVTVGKNEEIIDVFRGFHLKWQMVTKKDTHRSFHYQNGHGSHMLESEIRYFHLTFHKKHKNRVIDEYLPYVLEKARAVEEGKKTLKLYTLEPDTFHRRTNPWQSVNLDHPSNFKTLAMDEEIKKSVMDDLNRFLKRKELYRKVGKAWKRGYLLFGPPGTGKSSLIAAIANHLHFDVYDLELSDIKSNSDLRRLLISTENRSILVVEDIDASIDLGKRETHKKDDLDKAKDSKVTLSGVLNFIDGLWSSCGDERIIIFTTNHQEKLDPALLRPGRMDVHIPMSFCTPCGLRILASNYHGINEHRLLPEAEKLIDSTKVTPAEVAEQLLKEEDPETAIQGLIQFLQQKNGKNAENKNNVEGNELPMITEVATAGLRSFVDTVKKWILTDEAANAMKILALRVGEEEGETESLIQPGASLESSAGKEDVIISGTGMVEKITLSDEEMNAIKILIRVHDEDASRARERLLNQLGITAGDQDNVKITH